MLELDNLCKSYGSLEAVRGVSLQVRKGEVFGFLGPNGAGKTTTIKCCTGLLRPTAGRVSIGGYDVVEQAAAAKALIGYVPDTPFLYEKLTGREFVLFVAGLYGGDPVEMEKKAQDYFHLFEMADRMDQLIQVYSQGMRQKTALIAALLHQPQLLVLDEPTANLDPRSARLVKDVFRSYREQGRTVFMSTHIMEIAERLCDRVAIIHRGELRALGTMAELGQLRQGASLEDIFLEITGGHDPETQRMLAELAGEEGQGPS
jgi:ABC-2 type transport system ATP-binding protein